MELDIINISTFEKTHLTCWSGRATRSWNELPWRSFAQNFCGRFTFYKSNVITKIYWEISVLPHFFQYFIYPMHLITHTTTHHKLFKQNKTCSRLSMNKPGDLNIRWERVACFFYRNQNHGKFVENYLNKKCAIWCPFCMSGSKR